MEDSFVIDADPEKQISDTFANGESQKSDSRVTSSMLVISMVSVSLQFCCIGQAALTLLGLGRASYRRDSRCAERQVLLTTIEGIFADTSLGTWAYLFDTEGSLEWTIRAVIHKQS